MQRRSFLVSSGVALFGFSIGSGSRPALGVEFQISGDIEEDPADVTSILIDFSKLDIIPHYLDVDNQDYV